MTTHCQSFGLRLHLALETFSGRSWSLHGQPLARKGGCPAPKSHIICQDGACRHGSRDAVHGFETPPTELSTLTGEQRVLPAPPSPAPAPPKAAIRKLLPYFRSATWTANYVLKYLPTALLPRGPFKAKC